MRDMKQGALIMPAGLGTVESHQVDGTLTGTAPTPHFLVDLPIGGGHHPHGPKIPCLAAEDAGQQQAAAQVSNNFLAGTDGA